ncbi:MAG TPA: hypothetical protein VNJ52_04545 [Patescibacteria group bacterium]|nr:hypothetical protein [Patescibacteria group bacterium]
MSPTIQKPDHPCIVIPGIKGTGLANIYSLPPATTWSAWEAADQSLGDVDFESLSLDAAAQADSAADVVNRATQLLAIAYGSFARGLRGRSGQPVYLFPYDWRYSNVRAAGRLVNFVRMLQQKRPKQTQSAPWDKTFDFACHSMGGLVFRQFLAAWRHAWPGDPLPVNRIVFIATPHLGSLDAVEAMIRGETSLFDGRKELRKLARTFPGVYELLPNPKLARTVIQNENELDIFDINSWQENVTPDPQDPEDFNVEQRHLTAARDFINELPDVRSPEIGLAGRAFVIYGTGGETLRTVTVLEWQDGTKNWYDFDHAKCADGDQVVLVESARLAGIASLEIKKADVSFFSLKSHMLGSLHAFLPSMDEVCSATSRFFAGLTGPALLPKGVDPKQFHPA